MANSHSTEAFGNSERAAAGDLEEFAIEANGWRARVSPRGGSLRGAWFLGADGSWLEAATGYSGESMKVGGQGDVLIPFPGRIREGAYSFQGKKYQLDKNDKEGPNAIHGFLRKNLWEIVSRSAASVSFATSLRPDEHPGYPFSLDAVLDYDVSSEGLTCRFRITNSGDLAAPVAAGFHPYFTVGSSKIDEDLLHLPMASMLDFKDMLPTGGVLPVEGTPFDFRAPRAIGSLAINSCFLDPIRDADGLIRIVLSSKNAGRNVTVWMDKAFDFVVLYSGDPLPEPHRRASLAIEPMTCGSDAFNYQQWGLVSLGPGASLSGAWGVSAHLEAS